MNYLIQGDNKDVLKYISKKCKKKVGVVYIDPPYNTGKKQGKYKDTFGSHAQWQTFMKPRLKASLPLLRDDCVIFISIGNEELAHLKILCDEVFGEKNFVTIITWQNKNTTQNDKSGIANQTEYIVVYCVDIDQLTIRKDRQRESYLKKTYKNPDNDPRGSWRGGVQLFKEKNRRSFTVESPSGKKWNRGWNFNEEGWKRLELDKRIWWGADDNLCPVKKVYLSDVKREGRTAVNLWLGKNKDDEIREVGFTADGKKDLARITGSNKDFLYPKPVRLIKRILDLASDKDSVILDYFAGSGTTAQAVLECNEKDGGNRKFVLITNNEENICEEVTRVRIEKVISGYSYIDKKKEKIVKGIGCFDDFEFLVYPFPTELEI